MVKVTQTTKVKLSSDGNNHFSYGYCTYYVASRRNIPWFGNAGTWLSGARAAGFATGDIPQVGAIIVTSESVYGHVGIVEAVNGDGTITISEMNYSGFARITSRTIPVSYSAIKGYIY
jgi:surface antigen